MEVWKSIKGFGGKYRVSNEGNVMCMWKANQYQTHTGKPFILKQSVHRQGYLKVYLTIDGKTKGYYVHRLVGEAFLPNPNNLPQINHKDENKANNLVWVNEDGTIDLEKSNLEWCDGKYNSNYGTRVKRHRELVSKPVIQTTLDGNFVRKFASATEAEKECGYDSSYISMVCHGHRPNAYGYKFHFSDPSVLIETLDDLFNENIKDEDLE